MVERRRPKTKISSEEKRISVAERRLEEERRHRKAFRPRVIATWRNGQRLKHEAKERRMRREKYEEEDWKHYLKVESLCIDEDPKKKG